MKKISVFVLLFCFILNGCSTTKTGSASELTITQTIIREDCLEEGESMPLSALSTQKCCPGMELIPPPSDYYVLIKGICTAKCGNGICGKGETTHNCKKDC